MGWIRYAASGYMWGQIDIEEYRHYDNPANGNLNEVVPGKFIAFQVYPSPHPRAISIYSTRR